MLFKVSVGRLGGILSEIKMSSSQIHTPTVSMKLDETSCWERLRLEGKKISSSVTDQSLRYLLYIATKDKKRAEIPATTLSHLQLHTLIMCNSGQHLAGNSELFPV